MLCERCGETFEPARKSRRFCSNKCKFDARRLRITVACFACGTEFSAPLHRTDSAKYCSAKCRVTGITKSVTREAKYNLWHRFVTPGHPDECWPWGGSITSDRYGLARIGRHYQAYAHRLSYELFVGPIPDRQKVCHSCDNPPCCNPNHLFPGSNADNLRDMVSKGRQSRGENRPMRKLTNEDVRNIRKSSESQANLALRFGVNPSVISRVISRKVWRHVA